VIGFPTTRDDLPERRLDLRLRDRAVAPRSSLRWGGRRCCAGRVRRPPPDGRGPGRSGASPSVSPSCYRAMDERRAIKTLLRPWRAVGRWLSREMDRVPVGSCWATCAAA